MKLGEHVGAGRTSDVYRLGAESVVKVPHDDVPDEWPRFEAELTAAVRALDVPAPEVLDVISINGRSSVVFERVNGPSMWQVMLDQPAKADDLARELAAVQKRLLSAGIPERLPDLVDRMRRKIADARGLGPADRAEAVNVLEALPRGAALLHGDLHPGNVLMGANGPVVIDWFDATIGHPVPDVVRSSILLRPAPVGAPVHLPGATSGLLERIRRVYLAEFEVELGSAANELASWQAVVAASRLAEGAEIDEGHLVELWQRRNDEPPASDRGPVSAQ